MRFEIYPSRAIDRKQNGHGNFDKTFWRDIDEEHEGLADACGCYLFALQHGKRITPWYVGKTEKRSFREECFQATKINYYNELLADRRRGTPLLFLIPQVTISGNAFSKPTKSKRREIDFLETMLIGLALKKNGNLLNVKKTKLLREMKVPGILNGGRGRRTAEVRILQSVLLP